jgi:hypothetical protein
VQSNEVRREDVFQRVRAYEGVCKDIETANQCFKAYFEHVHPLIPVLHPDAFDTLYKLFSKKALIAHQAKSVQAKSIRDATSPEGRAVPLICSVLALGALTLPEDVILPPTGAPSDGPKSRAFGLALGFYTTCIRLLSYTHDNFESMLAYFFMVWIPKSFVSIAWLTNFRESSRYIVLI